ncbi:MAG: hypothetical protein PHF67_00215 [Candidatus Nanoarchaeia archaeon]|nr:hypothetical protein [Candidatus Nanoarchaeia archaeon]
MSRAIDNWLGVPAVLETEFGNVDGTVKFGIRIPLAPGTTPLQERSLDSIEMIRRERPDYWFVNRPQSIKVRLLTYERYDPDTIVGKAEDVTRFKYTLRRR